jgi:ATPase subunit of ABC transporter with duplicated ATPase domains
MLKFRDVTLRRGGRVLFAAANFAVFPGQKVGITGANGTGKSSLFALLRGELHAVGFRPCGPGDAGHRSAGDRVRSRR